METRWQQEKMHVIRLNCKVTKCMHTKAVSMDRNFRLKCTNEVRKMLRLKVMWSLIFQTGWYSWAWIIKTNLSSLCEKDILKIWLIIYSVWTVNPCHM